MQPPACRVWVYADSTRAASFCMVGKAACKLRREGSPYSCSWPSATLHKTEAANISIKGESQPFIGPICMNAVPEALIACSLLTSLYGPEHMCARDTGAITQFWNWQKQVQRVITMRQCAKLLVVQVQGAQLGVDVSAMHCFIKCLVHTMRTCVPHTSRDIQGKLCTISLQVYTDSHDNPSACMQDHNRPMICCCAWLASAVGAPLPRGIQVHIASIFKSMYALQMQIRCTHTPFLHVPEHAALQPMKCSWHAALVIGPYSIGA
eukprot:566442-Pelagomonas_calceolata.AAC.4